MAHLFEVVKERIDKIDSEIQNEFLIWQIAGMKEHSQMNKNVIARKTCFKSWYILQILGEYVPMYYFRIYKKKAISLLLLFTLFIAVETLPIHQNPD